MTQLRIIKRNNETVDFNKIKIENAIKKAMLSTDKGINEKLAEQIAFSIEEHLTEFSDLIWSVEQIQDLVEEYLMDSDRKDVARVYILYRHNKSLLRQEKKQEGLLTDAFISRYKHLPSPMAQLGDFVFYRTYSRWLPEQRRREYWYETVRRAVEYSCSLAPTSQQEAEQLYDNIFFLRQFLSGRTLYSGGGPAAKKFPMSNYNCSFAIANDFEAFKDLFYLLLIGAGVGLRTLKSDVKQLPAVRTDLNVIHMSYSATKPNDRQEYTSLQFEDNMAEIVVGDSKEGWTQALEFLLKLFYSNEYRGIDIIIMNYNNVRPKGERLKTFGGYASGYEPIMSMFTKITKVLIKDGDGKKRQLAPIDCLDIANIIGGAVVSGGVRRTSEVILFDPDDQEILTAKSKLYVQDEDGKWSIDESIAHRRMSNNTIQYYDKPTREQWHKHIMEMRYSGEPAFANMAAALKRRPDAEGGNPCMEIILRNRGMCNLTEVNVMGFVRDGVLDVDGLLRAQKMSARAGYRMACVDFELHKWDLVNKEDMLIGCSLTGWQDMVNATGLTKERQAELLNKLRRVAHSAADEMATQLGRNKPKLYTTIKPSGTISQLPGVSNGVHYSHSPYYIRRVRINAHDPLTQVVRELGYPIHPETGQTWDNCDTVVIEFPVKAPLGRTKNEVNAIEQLEMYKMFMEHYVDHNASITVHVKEHEWDSVEEWMWEHWDGIIAVSFISLDDNFYELMPYEEITEDEYAKRTLEMAPFNPMLLTKYEKEEIEFDLEESECDSGACPIR